MGSQPSFSLSLSATTVKGADSIIHKTSYLKVLWSLEARDLCYELSDDFSKFNRHQQHCPWDVCQISKRSYHFIIQNQALRFWAILYLKRHVIEYWNSPRGLVIQSVFSNILTADTVRVNYDVSNCKFQISPISPKRVEWSKAYYCQFSPNYSQQKLHNSPISLSYDYLCGKLWYLQHINLGDIIVTTKTAICSPFMVAALYARTQHSLLITSQVSWCRCCAAFDQCLT